MKETARPLRRTEAGIVKSNAMAKSILVVVERLQKVPKYGKYVRRRSTFMAHDERREAFVGDLVEIQECRRISKDKCWRLLRVLKKA
jgi:small subunit ribosomal protein S17